MKKFVIILSLFTLFSCAEFDDEYDLRNYIRDRHPYCELTKIDLGFWSYKVVDTTTNEMWIYVGSRTKSRVRNYYIPLDEYCGNLKSK